MRAINCLYKDGDHPTRSTKKRPDRHRGTPDTQHSLNFFEMAQEMCGKKWALLVAGSKGWTNYRHQANVCCLYQIIKKHGIPDDQIVVMMYDDIANNPKNPYPGNIVSVISNTLNVYPGVPKDYTGEDVNPMNFLNTLQGTGKKIISGPNDEIFIYMSTTGGNGIFAFPDQSLSGSELIEKINEIHHDNKFSKMVIYMDSDYSATMVKDLPQNIYVYAVSSCDQDKKNELTDQDKTRGVFLSDQFSAALLRFLYASDFKTATFKNLFDHINQSDKSIPCEFGFTNIRDDLLREFLQK